jgi:hypothetical protein
LVSLVGGGNDILRVTTDVPGVLPLLEGAVRRLRAGGADVLMATGTDPYGPLIGLTRGRSTLFYSGVWSIAHRYGAYVLDQFGMRSINDHRLWAPDRIHLTSEGHRRIANAALVALGLGPDDPDWDTPLPPSPVPVPTRLASNAAWVRRDLWPWFQRHIHGQSSGDHRAAKRPALTPAEPGAAVRGQ